MRFSKRFLFKRHSDSANEPIGRETHYSPRRNTQFRVSFLVIVAAPCKNKEARTLRTRFSERFTTRTCVTATCSRTGVPDHRKTVRHAGAQRADVQVRSSIHLRLADAVQVSSGTNKKLPFVRCDGRPEKFVVLRDQLVGPDNR